MVRMKLTQGDTRPPVVVQLTDANGPVSLSGCVVLLKFRLEGTTTTLLTLTGSLLPGTLQADGVTPDLSQYSTPGSGGRVKFNFPYGSLNIDEGYYEGEVQVTFPDATVQTPFPRLKFNLRTDF